jgi:hypothetical protein
MTRVAVAVLMVLTATASGSTHKKHKKQKAVVVAQVSVGTTTLVEDEPPKTGTVSEPKAEAPGPSVQPSLHLEEPRPAEVDHRPRRWGMMAGGISLWAVAYAADIGVTYGFHHDPSGVSAVPLVGPLIQCGDKYGYQGPMPMTGNAAVDKQMADQIAQANTLIQTVTYLGLALDFAGQLTGITLALVGALTHKDIASTGSSVRVAATGRGLSVSF